jgi:hypothetical protein
MMVNRLGLGVWGRVSARWVRLRPGVLFVLIAVAGLGMVAACLDRPLVESQPTTSNLFVDQIVQTSVDKIDLLFMIDNSGSMADKQAILKSAVPVLVTRLTSPICVNAQGEPTKENSVQGKCTNGKPEFPPINDIHVGIVTSSLGSHGGDVCADSTAGGTKEYTPDDHAHLLGTVRPAGGQFATFETAKTWNNTGFLAWDPDQKDTPTPGQAQPAVFQQSFQDMISAVGERGCGFEASLESWYRFLIDPEPPANVGLVATDSKHSLTSRGSSLVIGSDGSTTCSGCDLELLAQRKAFLRPDSLVAIVMLSDENDCSVRDDGQGWLVTKEAHLLPRATAVCATNPNDPCCRSCGSSDGPASCGPLATDPGCTATLPMDDLRDAENLRCFAQKQRFGVDLLYPTSRYVDALTKSTLTLQSDGKTQVPNPLFDSAGSGKPPRSPTLVFLAGIVGVPWQDIADAPSLSGAGLKYLSAADLRSSGRWPMLLGDPSASPPVPPSDPFMVEAIDARRGVNPITMDPIMPATSTSPIASPINGHEQNIPKRDDLQYACTFELKPPKPCADGDATCDCTVARAAASNSPLCQGAPANTQAYAKAYPGTRELQVLKDFQDQGIVASICPKLLDSANPESDPNYGYNPAVGAIIDRLKIALTGECLPRRPEIDPNTKQVACEVIEARPSGCGDCSQPGRAPADTHLTSAVRSELQAGGVCGVAGKADCSSYCECQIVQESGSDLSACEAGKPLLTPGYCYIDDPKSPAVEHCSATQKRALQFIGSLSNRIPANDAVAFIACQGAPLTQEAKADGG